MNQLFFAALILLSALPGTYACPLNSVEYNGYFAFDVMIPNMLVDNGPCADVVAAGEIDALIQVIVDQAAIKVKLEMPDEDPRINSNVCVGGGGNGRGNGNGPNRRFLPGGWGGGGSGGCTLCNPGNGDRRLQAEEMGMESVLFANALEKFESHCVRDLKKDLKALYGNGVCFAKGVIPNVDFTITAQTSAEHTSC